MFKRLFNRMFEATGRMYDAYRALRVMKYLHDLDRLLDECETYKYDRKRLLKLVRYNRLLWHEDVFRDAIQMMKHNLK